MCKSLFNNLSILLSAINVLYWLYRPNIPNIHTCKIKESIPLRKEKKPSKQV